MISLPSFIKSFKKKLTLPVIAFSILSITLLSAGLYLFFLYNTNAKPPELTSKSVEFTISDISAEKGGEFISKDQNVKLVFPAEFVEEDISIIYKTVSDTNIFASNRVSPMFELKAYKKSGGEITSFKKPITIETKLEPNGMRSYDKNMAGTYFYNIESKKWEKLEGNVVAEENKAVAFTDHFTTFTAVSGDPNNNVLGANAVNTNNTGTSGGTGGSATAPLDGVIIDNRDPEPLFRIEVFSKPVAWQFSPTGHKEGSLYGPRATVHDTSKFNNIWWETDGVTGEQEVFVSIPYIAGVELASESTYIVTYAGGAEKEIVVNQEANKGSWVSLGKFEFDGHARVFSSNLVYNGSGTHVAIDAVKFGGSVPNSDLIPPMIEDVKASTYFTGGIGKFTIQAKVTDEGSGVARVVLMLRRGNGTIEEYDMAKGTNDIYYVTVSGIKQGENLYYEIHALDVAKNEGIWDMKRGYVSRGSFGRYLGYHPGMVGRKPKVSYEKDNCYQCIVGQQSPDPVNTVNGNLMDTQKIITLAGRPIIDFYLSYNSQGGREGVFGESWTHSYNYHLIEMENPDYTGVFVQYPDGFVAEFKNFQQEPGVYENLKKTGSGYELTFKDQGRVTFDQDGDITRWEDPNGNGINFEYGEKVKYTLLSQITKIKADSGRELTLEYNGDGYVQKVNAPEGISVQFTYDGTDLTAIKDARGNDTKLEYTDHNLSAIISPKGHAYVRNTYDDQRRVVSQTAGKEFKNDFTYTDAETKIIDANGHSIIYKYQDKLLAETVDATGKSERFEFDENKNVKKYTNREGAVTEYRYDSDGNLVSEVDPLGYETKFEYNPIFNKPTKRIYKQTDYITYYEYDNKGNVTKTINSQNNSKTNEYNGFGQLILESDFNGNKTKYEYSPEGDVSKIFYPDGNSQSFIFDGIGRIKEYTNPNGIKYAYKYDGNSNLLETAGPLGYKVSYSYDQNNHKISETDANGGVIKYTYDESENITKEANQLDFLTQSNYGKMNEVISSKDAEGRNFAFEYTPNYLVSKFISAAGTTDEAIQEFKFNAMSKVVEEKDPEGRVKKYEYNKRQELIREITNATANAPDSENNVTLEYKYSPTGKVLEFKDANGFVTRYEFDNLDRIKKMINAENQITTYEHDAQGNRVKMTNARGFSTTYKYDSLNRIIAEVDAKGGESKFDYDNAGNMISRIDANGVETRYIYNELDRVVQKIENFKPNTASTEDTNVTTKYEYDLHGNVVKMINPRGFATTFKYDKAHRNIQVTDANGASYKIAYDKVNNILQIINRNQFATNSVYDNLNREIKFTNEEGHTETFTYDKVGNLTKYVNARGKQFTSSYDPLNRLKVATDPYGKTRNYQYDAMGSLLQMRDENGHTDQFIYDKVYRVKKTLDGENYETNYNYDSNGNVVERIDGNGNPTKYKYDELDRLVEDVNAENEIKKFSYDKLTNITMETEADGTKHQYIYDPIYRLVTVVNNYKEGVGTSNDTNVKTIYKYDPNGNLVKHTNPLGNVTSFEYEKVDRQIKETNPLGNNWQYTHDPEGNITLRKDANGATTKYDYYPDNLVKNIVYPNNKVAYKYSETNVPTQMDDNLGRTVWNYDDLDRITKQADPLNRNLLYSYDFVGNVTKLTYPDGRSVSHEYLKNDWLRKSTSSDNDSSLFTKDKVGNTLKIERSNSTISETVYDKVYRELHVKSRQVGFGNHLVDEYKYTYNDVGHITEKTAIYGWRQPDTVTTKYKYDGLHRLTSAVDSENSSQYEYDAAGNRIKMHELIKSKDANEVRSYKYDAANLLKEIDIVSPMPPNNIAYAYQYDKNGNRIDRLIKDNTGVDRGFRYSYDYENRMTRAQEYQGEIIKKNPKDEGNYTINDLAHTNIEYDGNGRRLVKTYYSGASQKGKRVEYTFDHLDPVTEYDMENKQRKNMYRASNADMLFFQEFKSEQAPNGTIKFYHYDGEGNISATTMHQGQSDHAYRFDEYGGVLPEVGLDKNQNNGPGWLAPHNEYTTSQKEYDSNMDLVYFGARHYEPKTGTWTTQDTYRGNISNPRSLHRTMYNYSTPINYVDWQGFVVNEKMIDDGQAEYTCNCGWIDWKHAGELWNNHTDNYNLVFDIRDKLSRAKAGDKLSFRMGARSGKEQFSNAKIHIVLKEGFETSKDETALGIYLQLSNYYEDQQGSLLQSGYVWIAGKTQSSYSEEDLVSNLLAFYQQYNPDYTKDKIRELCGAFQGDQKDDSSGTMKMLRYYESEGGWETRTSAFSPRLNPIKPSPKDAPTCVDTICPPNSSFPKEFQIFSPKEKGTTWREQNWLGW